MGHELPSCPLGIGVSRIYIMDENGENQESRAQDMAPLDAPSWSPDGGWIAYAATDEIRIGQIHVVKVVGFRRFS